MLTNDKICIFRLNRFTHAVYTQITVNLHLLFALFCSLELRFNKIYSVIQCNYLIILKKVVFCFENICVNFIVLILACDWLILKFVSKFARVAMVRVDAQ